jgi:hypothetical protein
MKLLLWETEFYALSVVTGKLELFSGTYVEAQDIQDALKAIRKMGLNYLQLTGVWFDNVEDVLAEDDFQDKLEEPAEVSKGMSFDDFSDWLEKSSSREGLVEALKRFRAEEGMEDYVKIIKAYIRKFDRNNKKDDSNDKKDTDEKMG